MISSSFSQEFESLMHQYEQVPEARENILKAKAVLSGAAESPKAALKSLAEIRECFSEGSSAVHKEIRAQLDQLLSKEEKNIQSIAEKVLGLGRDREIVEAKLQQPSPTSIPSLFARVVDDVQAMVKVPSLGEDYHKYYQAALSEVDHVLGEYREERLAGGEDPRHVDAEIKEARRLIQDLFAKEEKMVTDFSKKIVYDDDIGYEYRDQQRAAGFYFFCFMCRKYNGPDVDLKGIWDSLSKDQCQTLVDAAYLFKACTGDEFALMNLKKRLLASPQKEPRDLIFELQKQVSQLFTQLEGSKLQPDFIKLLACVQKDVSELLGNIERSPFLDSTFLITGEAMDKPIQGFYRDWYLFQAILRMGMKQADPETRRQLGLIMLQGYGKAAPYGTEDTLETFQRTPFLASVKHEYHRGEGTPILSRINEVYRKKYNVEQGDLFLVNGPLASEVLERDYASSEYDVDIDSVEKFEGFVDKLIEKEMDVIKEGEDSPNVLINCTKLLSGKDLKTMKELVRKLSEILEAKLNKVRQEGGIPLQEFQKSIIARKLGLAAQIQIDGQHVVWLPEITFKSDSEVVCDELPSPVKESLGPQVSSIRIQTLPSPTYRSFYNPFKNQIWHRLVTTGCLPTQDQARQAWLALEEDSEDILRQQGIPLASLATKGATIPTVCSTFSEFLGQNVVKKFKALSDDTTVPYLQVLPKGTVYLLEGLQPLELGKKFQDKNIGDLLQISYFRMLNAMNEAILRKEDPVAFFNQIELIHQEIQTILAVVMPYGDQDFVQIGSEKLTTGESPLVPKSLGKPFVYLKSSGRHAVESAISSVEHQKGSNHLTVAVLSDSYYETVDAFKDAKAHDLHVLDGDTFNAQGIERAFTTRPSKPIDLFVCEFHHNISLDRQVYKPEKITEQVKAMVDRKMVAEKFTVIFDTTMDLDQSDEIREFLADAKIQNLIKEGKLNVVFARSAQKFDMFGMDNYSGGIVFSLNDGKSFKQFNERMAHPQDQLSGLSYQGLTHLQKCAGSSLDEFRRAVMKNTQIFYSKLPKESLYIPEATNPMQISKLEDPRLVYVDIKFPSMPESAAVFCKKFTEMRMKLKWPITHRASFGFATTNFVAINATKLRLSLGLDDEKTLDQYAGFFRAIQSAINKITKKGRTPTDKELAAAIRAISVTDVT